MNQYLTEHQDKQRVYTSRQQETLTVRSRIAPVFVLFLLSPLIGEFLLGNTPISFFGLFPLYALLYGVVRCSFVNLYDGQGVAGRRSCFSL